MLTNYDGMLEAWADQASAMEANIEAMFGPPSTPPTLPSVTNYDGMLEAIAEQSYNAYINIAKVSGAYHDSVTNVYAMTLPSTLLDWFGIDVIGGKTIVWNQLCVEVNSTNWQPYITPSPCTYTYANNSYTATIVTKLDSSRWRYCAKLKNTIPLQTGHKYYCSFVVTCSQNMSVRHEITDNGSIISVVGGVPTKISQIQTATKVQTPYYVFMNSGDGVGESYTVANPMLIDLTLMFGAGNEPTTVAEFQQMFPADYYSFNQGQLMSAGVTEVVSKDANNTTIDTYPIPAEVQALTGYGWSAGSVYNYIDFERKVFVKRVARVDLGSLTWTYSSTNHIFTSANISNIKNARSSSAIPNLLCAKYISDSNNNVYGNVTDKTITVHDNQNKIWVYDSAYTDATTFKSAMSGVYLYYELATSIETDISAYLTDDYIAVEGGGTLTFPNSNGDDYRIPVPVKAEYIGV